MNTRKPVHFNFEQSQLGAEARALLDSVNKPAELRQNAKIIFDRLGEGGFKQSLLAYLTEQTSIKANIIDNWLKGHHHAPLSNLDQKIFNILAELNKHPKRTRLFLLTRKSPHL